MVDRLVATDVSSLADAAIRAEFLENRRESDRLEFRNAVLLAALHRRGVPSGDGAASTPAWVEHQTGQRASEARALLDAGLACDTLPLTAKSWAQGEISASAARAICAGRPVGHEAAYGEVEELLVEHAAARDWRSLRGLIAHCKRCADALDDREPADRNGTHLSKSADRWVLSGDFDDLGGTTLNEALIAATDPPTEGDPRSLSKRRSDALETIARFFLDHADLPVEGGEAPHVSAVLTWDAIRDRLTATSMRSNPTMAGPSMSPAQLGQLLCDAKISRIVIGPDGQPLDVGRELRTPPRWMRRALVARDKGCRFPGCGRRPGWCHAHHVIAWEFDGETNLPNLVLLCPYHHHLVHRTGWNATFNGTTFTVTNPHGQLIGQT